MDHSRRFPAEVDRVLQAEVESRPADQELHVGGVADEQHPAVAISVGQSGVDADRPVQQMRPSAFGWAQRQVRAHDPVDAFVNLLDRHGCVDVRTRPWSTRR
jgi:hypothetical protein